MEFLGKEGRSMNEAKTLAEIIKALPSASSVSGLSMICANSSGILNKLGPKPLLWYPDAANPPGWADSLENPGIYHVSPTAFSDAPQTTTSSGNILIHLGGSSFRFQILFAWYQNNFILFRQYAGSKWYDWKKIALT